MRTGGRWSRLLFAGMLAVGCGGSKLAEESPAPSPSAGVTDTAGTPASMAAVEDGRDKLEMAFDLTTGQAIPAALPDPGSWLALGTLTVPGKVQSMAWVRPEGVSPRAVASRDLTEAETNEATNVLRKPLEDFGGNWTEGFRYEDVSRPAISPQEFLEVFRQDQIRNCPSAVVSTISTSEDELVLEVKSMGCEGFGEVSEVVRFLFGKTDLFHMTFLVKAREMTAAQRELGVKAVTAWRLQGDAP